MNEMPGKYADFGRDELQNLRERVLTLAYSKGMAPAWKRAHVALADAVDRLDAMIARTSASGDETIITLDKLDELIEVQCTDGSWNFNLYHFGLANGLILARSAMTGEEPEFLTAPEEGWLENRGQTKTE